jgi:hypothetical protein
MGASLDHLDPDLRQGLQELQQAVALAGLQSTITSTVRSYKDQKFLYDRYLAGKSVLPAAPPNHSAHEFGWAFDLVVTPGDYQSAVGSAWETYWGGKWGGQKDPVHFELPGASQLAWKLGEQGALPIGAQPPERGPAFYKLADFFSSFVPGLGELQLVDTLVGALDGNNDLASWYLQHPAEALRDLAKFFGKFFSSKGGSY